jgi:hypothetical protein
MSEDVIQQTFHGAIPTTFCRKVFEISIKFLKVPHWEREGEKSQLK